MGETETLLFIGGVADGRRQEVRRAENRVLVRKTDAPGSDVYERAMLEQYVGTPPNHRHYKAHFFRLKGMVETEAVILLLDHYSPPSHGAKR